MCLILKWELRDDSWTVFAFFFAAWSELKTRVLTSPGHFWHSCDRWVLSRVAFTVAQVKTTQAVVACAYLHSDVGARLVSECKFFSPLIATLASDAWYVYMPGALRPDNAQRGSAFCFGRRC